MAKWYVESSDNRDNTQLTVAYCSVLKESG